MLLNRFVSGANTADVKGVKGILVPELEKMVRIEVRGCSRLEHIQPTC